MPMSPLSPLSPIRTSPSGLHINPEPGKEPYVIQSRSVYDPGETSRRVSLPSASRGNISQANNLQTWDSHLSDPQSTDAVPYIKRANRRALGRSQSSISQINTTQNNEHRDSNHDYTQAKSLRRAIHSRAILRRQLVNPEGRVFHRV